MFEQRVSQQALAVPFTLGEDRRMKANTAINEIVKDRLRLLMMTNSGERVMRPSYGGNVRSRLFGVGEEGVLRLETELKSQVASHIPEIEVTTLRVDVDYTAGSLHILIEYKPVGADQAASFDFTFQLPRERV